MQDGRHSGIANIDKLYKNSVVLLTSKKVQHFDDLIEKVVYPIFMIKFSRRLENLNVDLDDIDMEDGQQKKQDDIDQKKQ